MNQEMIKPKSIAQLGNVVLRQTATWVDNIQSTEIQQIIDDLLSTVAEAGGVGIAAPQINISKRIFIICSKANARYPEAPNMKPTVIINPKLIQHSNETEKNWEGCLSVPSIRGLVPRYKQIDVEYFDQYNIKHTDRYCGFIARIFQHELDHLNGLTFIDRVESTQDIFSESEWFQQIVNK